MTRASVWGLLPALFLLAYSLGDGAPAIRYDRPITIRKGGVYRGNWQSLSWRIPAVTIATSQPVIIEYSNIRSRGTLIASAYHRANITVRHTRGEALNPGMPLRAYRFPGRFLDLEEITSLTAVNNEMIGTSGIYVRAWYGKASRGETIKILRNRARNIDGRYSVGEGRYSTKDFRIVQFTQFNDVKNIVGAEIAWNEIINEPGKSRVEENINMYVSSGVPSSRIKIHDNYIQGAYPIQVRTDSYSGGGINAADGSSKTVKGAAAHILVYNNQIVGTGNLGIGISAGHDIQVFKNRLVSSGYTQGGVAIKSQNVGLYVWDPHGDKKRKTFFNNYAHDNVVGWAQPLKGKNVQNPFWFPDCARDRRGASLCRNNTVLPGPITLTMERQEWVRWQNKLRAAKIRVGPAAPPVP